MKIKPLLLAAAFCVAGINLQAQTATNAAPTITQITSELPGGFGQLASDAGAFFTDAQPYFGTNGTTMIGAGALYSDHKWGGFADVAVISLATNNQVTLGFTTAYLDGSWYDASLSLKAGTTWNVPVIGPVYTFVESGPGYNFHAGHVIAQNFTGVMKGWNIGKVNLSAFGGAGNISDRSGLAYMLGVNFNVKF